MKKKKLKVDPWLKELAGDAAEQYKRAKREISEQEELIKTLQDQLEQAEEMMDNKRDSLIEKAEEEAENITDEAEEKASLIYDEAGAEAEDLIEKAQIEAEMFRLDKKEYIALGQAKENLKNTKKTYKKIINKYYSTQRRHRAEFDSLKERVCYETNEKTILKMVMRMRVLKEEWEKPDGGL